MSRVRHDDVGARVGCKLARCVDKGVTKDLKSFAGTGTDRYGAGFSVLSEIGFRGYSDYSG